MENDGITVEEVILRLSVEIERLRLLSVEDFRAAMPWAPRLMMGLTREQLDRSDVDIDTFAAAIVRIVTSGSGSNLDTHIQTYAWSIVSIEKLPDLADLTWYERLLNLDPTIPQAINENQDSGATSSLTSADESGAKAPWFRRLFRRRSSASETDNVTGDQSTD